MADSFNMGGAWSGGSDPGVIVTHKKGGGFAGVGSEISYGPNQYAISQVQADAAKFPEQMRMQRFNQVFPWLQGIVGSGQFGAFGPFTAGGQSGEGPAISAGPVWDPQQIQQHVNAMRGQNDAATASRQRDVAQSAAGRGFGASSPLVMALQGNLANQNLATNTSGENEMRWNAALGNAQQLLKGQQAREQQFASRQQEDIERRKPVIGFAGQLLNSLTGLV